MFAVANKKMSTAKNINFFISFSLYLIFLKQ
jgi:hypothetical protein